MTSCISSRIWSTLGPSISLPMRSARKRGFKHYYVKGLLDVDPVTGCWIFLGRQIQGYGIISRKNSSGRWVSCTAQRYFFELYRFPLPSSLEVAHECHRRSCVNPHHLRADTKLGNIADWFVDQCFSTEQREEVCRLMALDLPVSVIADRLCAPRPYIHRLIRELNWQKHQTSFDFYDIANPA